jgi:CRISPR-associated exonuclease Cas4
MGLFVEGSARLIANILFAGGIGLLLFSVACFLLLFNERRIQRERLIEERHQALGLPPGELVYENTDGLGEPLTSDIHPLIGKPSYVVKLPNKLLLPIDLKPVEQNSMTPDPHHVLQLATYCLILEEYAEQPPTHGIVRYTDREFIVEYTPALRKKVIRLAKEMDLCTAQQPPALKKQKAAKCRACIYQPICPVGLGK